MHIQYSYDIYTVLKKKKKKILTLLMKILTCEAYQIIYS